MKKRIYLTKNFIEYLEKVTKMRDDTRKELGGLNNLLEFHEYEKYNSWEKIAHRVELEDNKIIVRSVELGTKLREEKEKYTDYYSNGLGKFPFEDTRTVCYSDPYYKNYVDEYPAYLLDAFNIEKDCEEQEKMEELQNKINQEVENLVEKHMYDYYSRRVNIDSYNYLMNVYGKDNYVISDQSTDKMKKDKLNANFNATVSDRIASFVLSGTRAANNGVLNLKMYDCYVLKDNYTLRKGTPENLTYDESIDYAKKDLIDYMYSLLESNSFEKYLAQLTKEELFNYIKKDKYDFFNQIKRAYIREYDKKSDSEREYLRKLHTNAKKRIESLKGVLKKLKEVPQDEYPISITFNLDSLEELIDLYDTLTYLIYEPYYYNEETKSEKVLEQATEAIKEYIDEQKEKKEYIRSLKEQYNKSACI